MAADTVAYLVPKHQLTHFNLTGWLFHWLPWEKVQFSVMLAPGGISRCCVINTSTPFIKIRPCWGHLILIHWGRVTHICVGKLTIIGSDNGLAHARSQAITWTIVGILLIGPQGINFSEMLIEIHTFSFKKINLKCRLENGGHFVPASMC